MISEAMTLSLVGALCEMAQLFERINLKEGAKETADSVL
jgi:hypothetical protein